MFDDNTTASARCSCPGVCACPPPKPSSYPTPFSPVHFRAARRCSSVRCSFAVSSVIEGWRQALLQMRQGGRLGQGWQAVTIIFYP